MKTDSARLTTRLGRGAAWLVGLLLVVGCSADVLHDLPESEANQVVATLSGNGVGAKKTPADPERNTWTVRVARHDRSRALTLLTEYKLPRGRERRFQDVFGKSKLVSTPMEERALFLEALQGELVATLESVGGVIDARVHLVLPEKDLTGQLRHGATASVVVEYQGSEGGSPLTEADIQRLVAHAVEGLQPRDVAAVLKASSLVAPASWAKGTPMTGASPGGDVDLVASAGLLLERASVGRFRLYAAAALALALVLGTVVFLGNRANEQLKKQILALENRVRTAARVGAPPRPLT